MNRDLSRFVWHCQCDRCVTTTYDKKLAPRCRYCHRDMVLQDDTDAILRRIKAKWVNNNH